MSAVSYAAIPSASATASGIVTTDAQTFAGDKTFSGTIATGTGTQAWQIATSTTLMEFKSGDGAGTTRASIDNAGILTAKIKETRASTGISFWVGTQAQYDALGSVDSTTLYIITE